MSCITHIKIEKNNLDNQENLYNFIIGISESMVFHFYVCHLLYTPTLTVLTM